MSDPTGEIPPTTSETVAAVASPNRGHVESDDPPATFLPPPNSQILSDGSVAISPEEYQRLKQQVAHLSL